MIRHLIDSLFEAWGKVRWEDDDEKPGVYSPDPDLLVRRSNDYAVIGFVDDVGYALRGPTREDGMRKSVYHSRLQTRVVDYLVGNPAPGLFIEGQGLAEAEREKMARERAQKLVWDIRAKCRAAADVDGNTRAHQRWPSGTTLSQ